MRINPTKIGSTQTIHVRYLNAATLDLDKRGIALRSEMCTAKTSNVLLKLIAKHKRVLIVTPKRLYAKSILGVVKRAKFDFHHYRDEGFWQTDHNLVVVELESLHNLYRRGMKPYELIVMDESETILTQMVCDATHKHNLRRNWETLEWLIDTSEQCFTADARMTRITTDFLAHTMNKREIHYIHNTYQIPMQVNWYVDTHSWKARWLIRSRTVRVIICSLGPKTRHYTLTHYPKNTFPKS
jgi:hypothetical protein